MERTIAAGPERPTIEPASEVEVRFAGATWRFDVTGDPILVDGAERDERLLALDRRQLERVIKSPFGLPPEAIPPRWGWPLPSPWLEAALVLQLDGAELLTDPAHIPRAEGIVY